MRPSHGTVANFQGTAECTEYAAIVHGKMVRIIDTPGLDDSPGPNLGILQKIAVKLHEIREHEISAVIYFHRIISPRLTGPARSNIEIFEQICGKAFLPRALFVTTMWDMVSDAARKRYEKAQMELETKQLKSLGVNGTRFMRFDNSKELAMDVLGQCITSRHKGRFKLQLGEDVARWGTTPSDVRRTEAGKVIVRQSNRTSSCTIL